ncbi:unnamed protein product [Prunus armeniaca]
MPKVQPLSSGGQVVGRSAASLGYRNEDQGVEVWAVHRKGSSAGGGIFIEYGLGLKEIAQEYNLNWDSSNTEAGSSILNLEFF